MPRRSDIKKVMVIGSGPIVIGQAAEFDYAGTQACRALREEGIEVVLLNSNPATIMTDTEIADHVYIEPLNVEFAGKIIAKEKPDGLLPTLGGQTGLNLASQLATEGVLEEHGVELLGTPLTAIQHAEDRDLFRNLMRAINEPVPESWIVESTAQLKKIAASNPPYPLIMRPAYTLGGTGGGIARNAQELLDIGNRGLSLSMRHQVLVERSLIGWKEIEYEVMRDANDTCITVCSMENFDPMGVHTGDSIVVAPCQTLCDEEYQMLRTASLKIIRALGIEGGCNVQLALNPKSFEYYVIEVNPRVSRSSALASKATGYPIARVAAKIASGLRLDEIPNAVTQKTLACFEPTIDYIVVKIPRWPFDKFSAADRTIGTQMKATGEVMAIDRTFEAALMKAVRSMEIGQHSIRLKNGDSWSYMDIEEGLRIPNDERLFVIGEAFRRGMMVEEIALLSSVDPWFLHKVRSLIRLEKDIQDACEDVRAALKGRPSDYGVSLLAVAKELRLPDALIAELVGMEVDAVREGCRRQELIPAYKMVDTCAAEFDAATPYFYSCSEQEDEGMVLEDAYPDHPRPSPLPSREREKKSKAIVLGSGPIRIGQGIEFDYCSVHAVWALREAGYESIIINNNPETVSTDFDTSDKLYFEPLTAEDVLNVVAEEQPEGVIVQFGGQTAINLAEPLHRAGVRIMGTSFDSIMAAEDRDEFEKLLRELDIPKPPGRAVTSVDGALEVAEEIGYPVLVRPSWVLGGRAMEIVHNRLELLAYMQYAVDVSPKAPILVDKYIVGREVEVDVISDGEDCLIPSIMEHIERAGVHSGDSMAVCPPETLSESVIDQIISHSMRLARALDVKGLMNVQYVVEDNEVQVLEVNPRASRTVPYLSKITGVPMVKVAVGVMLGRSLKEQGYESGRWKKQPNVAVKAPVFSFAKLTGVDIALAPEMKSTGEIMGIDTVFSRALYKALVAAGIDVPTKGSMVATIADQDKAEALPIIKGFADLGFRIYATKGTTALLRAAGIEASEVRRISGGSPNLLDLIRGRKVDLLINTISKDRRIEMEGAIIRAASVQYGVPCITSLDTAKALLYALSRRSKGDEFEVRTIDRYVVARG